MPRTLEQLHCRKAVVFGGSGFIGSHVVRALLDSGADVVSFDLHTPEREVAGVGVVKGDIADARAVASVIDGADHIFALAGGLGVLRSIADPMSDLMSSCAAQVTLLEAVRTVAPGASVVFSGSRLEYGPSAGLPADEDCPVQPESPYAIHKAACSAHYQAYAHLHGLHTTVLRLPNPYGAHVRGRARTVGFGILNLFVDTALDDGCIQLYGGGVQLRDFVHVGDVAQAALIASVTPEAAGEIINIGSGEPRSLRSAAELIVELCGAGRIDASAPWPTAAAAVETGDFYFDISKAGRVLDWRPRVGFAEGIADVVAAMRAKQAG